MTKLEEIAQEIGDSLYSYCRPDVTPNTWREAMDAARVALRKLRFPSAAMILAGESVPQGAAMDNIDVAAIWHAMVDAAAKEGA